MPLTRSDRAKSCLYEHKCISYTGVPKRENTAEITFTSRRILTVNDSSQLQMPTGVALVESNSKWSGHVEAPLSTLCKPRIQCKVKRQL